MLSNLVILILWLTSYFACSAFLYFVLLALLSTCCLFVKILLVIYFILKLSVVLCILIACIQ